MISHKAIRVAEAGAGRAIFRRLLGYLKPHTGMFVVAVLASILYAGVDAYIVRLLKPLVDEGLVSRDPQFIAQIPFLIPCIFFVRGVASFFSSYGMAWVGRKILLRLRSELFSQYMRLPVSFFDAHNSGELLSKMVFNIEQVYKACTDIVVEVVREGFLVIFLLVVMWLSNWQLTLVFLGGGPLIAGLLSGVSRKFRQLSFKTQDAMGSIMHATQEALDGHQVLRLFGGHVFMSQRLNEALKQYNHREMREAFLKAISVPVVQFLGGLLLALTLFLGLGHGLELNLSPGTFSALFASMIALLKPVKQLTSMNNAVQKAIAGATSVFEILDLPTEPDLGTYTADRVQGHICYRGVSFTYPRHSAEVLQNITLDIPARKTIAFVGHSGAGKTSLVHLLPRFYDGFVGHISIDGVDIRDYTLDNLRKHIALVSQHVVLFNETIRENIVYGTDRAYTDEEVWAVLKLAQALGFVEALPLGLDTKVGEKGVLLSGGQRQRLAIARAFFKNAPILILDEATSSLDAESEHKIQMALESLMQNRTTLVIAHRLSTVKNADAIVVMDRGSIIEAGTSESLLAQEGAFAELYATQWSAYGDRERVV
jgi:subfamily B ATP-binding cassette protein MsbA